MFIIMPKILGVFKTEQEKRLNSYSLPELREEVSKVQLVGYSSLNKKDLVAFMMDDSKQERSHLFKHLKGKKGPEKGKEGPTVAILMTYTVGELRKEVSKTLLKGFKTMSKGEVIALIMLHSHRFSHLLGRGSPKEDEVPEDALDVENFPDSRFHPDGYNLIVTDAIEKLREERAEKSKERQLPLYRDIPFFKKGATVNPDTGEIFTKEAWRAWRRIHSFGDADWVRDTEERELEEELDQARRVRFGKGHHILLMGGYAKNKDILWWQYNRGKQDAYMFMGENNTDPTLVGTFDSVDYNWGGKGELTFNKRFQGSAFEKEWEEGDFHHEDNYPQTFGEWKKVEAKRKRDKERVRKNLERNRKFKQEDEEKRIRGRYSKSQIVALREDSAWATFAEEKFSYGETESLPYAWELYRKDQLMTWREMNSQEKTLGEYIQNEIQGPEM